MSVEDLTSFARQNSVSTALPYDFRCYRSDHNYNSLASFENEVSKLEAEVEG